MARVKHRNYSAYTTEACRLLATLVRNGRKEKGMTVEELAERAGTSPSFVRRLEQGGLKGEIGVVFEVACIAGVPLFTPEGSDHNPETALRTRNAQAAEKAALLPRSVRKPREKVQDDF